MNTPWLASSAAACLILSRSNGTGELYPTSGNLMLLAQRSFFPFCVLLLGKDFPAAHG
jgi:hypothetical protein